MKKSDILFILPLLLCSLSVTRAYPQDSQLQILTANNVLSVNGTEEYAIGDECYKDFRVEASEDGDDSGTSMAAPHVSGVAALMLERNPNLTSEQVREIIAKTARKEPDYYYFAPDEIKEFGTWSLSYGYGQLDAYKAVINTQS